MQRLRLGKAKAPRSTWPEDRGLQRDRAVQFFELELSPHFQAEERYLFPLAEAHLPPDTLVSTLREQHRELERLIDQLRTLPAGQVETTLLRFADLLEDHIRKEERLLFEAVQERIPVHELSACGEKIEAHLKKRPPRCVRL